MPAVICSDTPAATSLITYFQDLRIKKRINVEDPPDSLQLPKFNLHQPVHGVAIVTSWYSDITLLFDNYSHEVAFFFFIITHSGSSASHSGILMTHNM